MEGFVVTSRLRPLNKTRHFVSNLWKPNRITLLQKCVDLVHEVHRHLVTIKRRDYTNCILPNRTALPIEPTPAILPPNRGHF